ncbi:MAG: UDP-2,4-diacetamido-2,4,6-trideoxy-beta-L-altropyranose hydrolase [Dissulfurispiraceae bacterium]|nr:UDP-2,4-diacetamido-2,4,6-trideoxy-beta-L-altropyranose hydrolase [Dissulfurispiraceae bacterium]
MKVAFRADASIDIGTGHIMRCLTLADELRNRGAEINFICREHTGNLIDLIQGRGYLVVTLPLAESEYFLTPDDVAHADWLGDSWQQDAADTIAALGKVRTDWLIIDHYAIDHRWEEILRPHVSKIMVIDDLADRLHDCDLLLDQNLYMAMNTRYDNLVSGSCIKLLGPAYALLRPEFATARKKLRQRDGQIRRVLVFFGGVDPTNETEKALQALAGRSDRQYEVDVVVGISNPHKESIHKFCNSYDGFCYYCQVSNIAELMSTADLAIGATGATTWERCAMGLPALVTYVADNQKQIAESTDHAGVIICMGALSSVSQETYKHRFSAILSNSVIVRVMSEKAIQLVDCNGLLRVVEKMVCK